MGPTGPNVPNPNLVRSQPSNFPVPGVQSAAHRAAGLQTLQDAKRFVDRASDVQIVDDRVLKYAFRVDDEQTAKSDVRIIDEDVV
jgi:hypothetical protein